MKFGKVLSVLKTNLLIIFSLVLRDLPWNCGFVEGFVPNKNILIKPNGIIIFITVFLALYNYSIYVCINKDILFLCICYNRKLIMNPKPPKLRSIIGHKGLDTCFLCIKDSKWGGYSKFGACFCTRLMWFI